jgi:hypothetical protein
MNTDIPDILAGALGVSRATAYDLMNQTLKESNNLTSIVLHRDDLHTITKWIEKFPQSDYVTIEVDNTNPNGSLVSAKIFAQIHGDHVHLIKTIVDESGF